VGALGAALVLPVLRRADADLFQTPYGLAATYVVLCTLGGLLLFVLSRRILNRVMQLSAAVERRWSGMSNQQIILSAGWGSFPG
jgi:hypothetical protein